jgi:hypothetical protein
LTGVRKMEVKLHLFNLQRLFDHCDQLLASIIVPPPQLPPVKSSVALGEGAS